MARQRQWAAWMMAGLLWAPGAAALPPQAAPVTLAQANPTTITGQLDENSTTLESGRRVNYHTIQGNAGDTLTIELTTDGFAALLVLFDPETREILEQASGATARLQATLPRTGSYAIGVAGTGTNEINSYRLQWQGSSSTTEQSDALDRATTLNQGAIELYRAGRYMEAEPLYQESLDIRREQLGDRHPAVATSLNNLAELYRAQGRYGEVEPLHQESLDIRREQLGDRHPDVATSLNNLALLYLNQGRYGEAEPLFQESLAIRHEQLGERHPSVATSLNNLAGLYQDQGRYGEAEPLFQEALDIYREQLGDRHPDMAASLNNLAGLYQDQGRYGEAEPLFQEALDIYREQWGNRHPSVATSLIGLANLYQAQGRYGEAEPLFQEALDIYREQLGDRHPNVAASLNNLAGLYQAQGRYGEAELLFQEALDIRHEQLGNRHPDVATSLNNLALLYQDQGRYGEAELLFQEALDIRHEQLGNRHPDVATSLNNLALLYQDQGRYGEVEPLFQESLAILREQWGNRHPDVATSLNNLAGLYRAQGRYGEAEPLYQEALDIRREQLGERHPNVATSLNNLASLYRAQGRYGEAEPLYQEALDIYREQWGNRHPDVATSLNNLAGLYRAQGRYGEAEPLYQEALDIRREQWGNRHPDVATSLNNLASLYQAQGRYGEAEPLYQESLAILREQLGESHPDVASSLNNLASLYQAQRRYGEAEPLYQESLAIRREQLGNRHPDVATSLNNLAGLYRAQGRYGEAEPLYQESLATFREQLGNRHPDVATSLNNLAALYQAQGLDGEAVMFLSQGLDIEEWHLDLNLTTLPETQRQAYVATISGTGQQPISLNIQSAPDSPEAAELALTTLLRRKGRILDAGTDSLQRLRQNLTPDDQATLAQLTDTQRQLANLTFNPPENLPPEQYRARLAELEAQATQLEATLARRSATFRVETTPVDIAAVQAQIPTKGVLVEYVRYRPFDATAANNNFGTARYAAYLLFPDGRIQAVDLGDAAEIDAAVLSFVGLLQDTRADFRGTAAITVQVSRDRIDTVTDTLKALVFDPIAPHLQGREHLLISPDGQLNLLPFEALPATAPFDSAPFDSAQGASRERSATYLVEQYQISYLNTGRDLVRFGVVPPSRNPAVLVGNPNYDTADPTVQIASSRGDNQRATVLGQLRFGPLPGTEAELAAIQPLFTNPVLLAGDQATENALKEVQSPRILHIATHGFFLENVDRTALETSRGDIAVVSASGSGGGGVAPAQLAAQVENPLLRSGLALAGFNTRASGGEDGVLTALEASQLNLFGTQLVVLSACDTGLGDVNNGEGVYGLRRAFGIAGAETQLLSLWQVDDFGTQSLMARYYEKLLSGMGRSEALRAVQLELIQSEEYSHPYYWAAFVLAGNWRPL